MERQSYYTRKGQMRNRCLRDCGAIRVALICDLGMSICPEQCRLDEEMGIKIKQKT